MCVCVFPTDVQGSQAVTCLLCVLSVSLRGSNMKSVYIKGECDLGMCAATCAPTGHCLNNRYAKRLQKRNKRFVSVSTVLCFWGLMFTRTTALRSHLSLSLRRLFTCIRISQSPSLGESAVGRSAQLGRLAPRGERSRSGELAE